MKTIRNILILLPCLLAVAHAKIPEKAPLVKYSGLWTNSPFTSKPPVDNPPPTENPFNEYTLTGIAPVPGGYMITIMNKKNPDQKMVITPDSKSQFKVVSVDRNPGKRLGTTVVLSTGSVEGTVSFEPELVTLKAPPTAAQNANPAPLPPGVNPAQVTQPNGTEAQRQPRPRIVPPPTPTNTQQPAQGEKPASGDRRIERRK